jgi:hypothetical protein
LSGSRASGVCKNKTPSLDAKTLFLDFVHMSFSN